MPAELIIVFMFLVLQLCCNALASVMGLMKVANYNVYTINSILSFLVLNYLFYVLFRDINIKPAMITGIIIFSTVTILSLLNGQELQTFSSNITATGSFIIVALCLYYFYTKFAYGIPGQPVTAHAIFWAIAGIFTYYTGSFFIFISYKYLIESHNRIIGTIWRFHNVLLMVCCGYITYGILWKGYRKILQ